MKMSLKVYDHKVVTTNYGSVDHPLVTLPAPPWLPDERCRHHGNEVDDKLESFRKLCDKVTNYLKKVDKPQSAGQIYRAICEQEEDVREAIQHLVKEKILSKKRYVTSYTASHHYFIKK